VFSFFYKIDFGKKGVLTKRIAIILSEYVRVMFVCENIYLSQI